LNDTEEVDRKARELLSILLEDNRRRRGTACTLRNFIPAEMHGTVADDESFSLPASVYCAYLTHSEEDQEVLAQSKIFYCPELLDQKDKFNIDFDHNNRPLQESNKFHTAVLHDLKLRGHSAVDLMQMSREDRQVLLKDGLKLGRKIRMNRNALQLEEKAAQTQLVPVERAIPCILHAKNRTAEKFLEQLLMHGLHGCCTVKDKKAFIDRVQRTINETVMGKAKFNELGQWTIPLEKDKLGDIKLSCPDANAIVDRIDVVVEECTRHLPDQRQEEWMSCALSYAMLMDELKSRKVFTYDDVCEFQNIADDFGEQYIYLTGVDGMTNYFHFLIAGHFSYYLFRYKNLYKYSQQGWERINGKAKRSYHHNTQKGGGRGGTSKLLPIMRMFLRELLWRFGHADEVFTKVPKADIKYGKAPKHLLPTDEELDLITRTILTMGTDEDIFGTDDENIIIGEV
jgi:hypothetical protein